MVRASHRSTSCSSHLSVEFSNNDNSSRCRNCVNTREVLPHLIVKKSCLVAQATFETRPSRGRNGLVELGYRAEIINACILHVAFDPVERCPVVALPDMIIMHDIISLRHTAPSRPESSSSFTYIPLPDYQRIGYELCDLYFKFL
jgi:hypothetical protein